MDSFDHWMNLHQIKRRATPGLLARLSPHIIAPSD